MKFYFRMDNQIEINSNQETQQDISQEPLQSPQPQQQSLEDKLMEIQDKWVDNVKELNVQMKDLHTLNILMNEVYYKRQEAVDMYYGMSKVLANRTRDYKSKASGIYNALKSGQAGLRYTNEGAITLQIETKLSAEKETIDVLTNFTNFMKETIQTIDNIIYGINSKIKVYEMLNGLKF